MWYDLYLWVLDVTSRINTWISFNSHQMKMPKIVSIIDFIRSILALFSDFFNLHNVFTIWNKCDVCFERHEKDPNICIQHLERKLKTLRENQECNQKSTS